MSAPVQASDVWTVTLHYHYDDYKRAESSVETIGVFTTRRGAVLAGIGAAYSKNDERGKPAAREAYSNLVHSALNIDFSSDQAAKDFLTAHGHALEQVLGEGEFGLLSTGYRPEWLSQKVTGEEDAMAKYNTYLGKNPDGSLAKKPKKDKDDDEYDDDGGGDDDDDSE